MFLHVLQCILIGINQNKFVIVEHNMAAHVEVLCQVVNRGLVSVPLGLGNASSLEELASNDTCEEGRGQGVRGRGQGVRGRGQGVRGRGGEGGHLCRGCHPSPYCQREVVMVHPPIMHDFLHRPYHYRFNR